MLHCIKILKSNTNAIVITRTLCAEGYKELCANMQMSVIIAVANSPENKLQLLAKDVGAAGAGAGNGTGTRTGALVEMSTMTGSIGDDGDLDIAGVMVGTISPLISTLSITW